MITATATLTGTITATAQIRSIQTGSCAAATVTNQAETYSLSIASGATEKLPYGLVRAPDGSDVQVDYKPAAQGYIYVSPLTFTVSASVDDSSPDFGDTINLTATGTGLTGVTWYADGFEIGTGTPLAWSVNMSGTFNITAVATDGTEYAQDSVSITAALAQLIETDANAHRWWDFSQTGTLTGDPVETIADAKGSGDDLTQASVALRPARTTINGLTAAIFTRAAVNYLEKTGGSTTNYEEVTLIMAFRPTEVYTNTTDRLFTIRKNGQNDFNGANSIALESLNNQCAGGSKKSNMGAGAHIKVIRLSISNTYLKERLYSRSDYIDNQATLTGSQLGLIFEIIRWGYQVDEDAMEMQVFTRILTDGECDTEANKIRWKWGAELT